MVLTVAPTLHSTVSSGWLEADYGVECWDAAGKYGRYSGVVGAAAAFFMFGVPSLFVYLVYKFQNAGKEGDTVVSNALGWMCTLS